MFYREAGQLKTTYAGDMAIFPIAQDRWGMMVILAVAVLGVPIDLHLVPVLLGKPLFFTERIVGAFLTPFLIWSIAAIGLNILTGYTGQLSLGHGAFMTVGAYTAYNLASRLPDLPVLLVFVGAGLVSAAFGILVGLPSLRIKGFYLAVSTLAAQFFVEWMFANFSVFSRGSAGAVLGIPDISVLGYRLTSILDNYYLILAFAVVMTVLAKNLVRSEIGRAWMAVRDMNLAAEIIGIRPLRAKLLAFAVSSFYAGVAGALYAFAYVKTLDPAAFGLFRSFELLFMIIVGGLGSIVGGYLGAAFFIILPIVLNILGSAIPEQLRPGPGSGGMIFGGLIIFFLIVEPRGLAGLWSLVREKARLWPFPH